MRQETSVHYTVEGLYPHIDIDYNGGKYANRDQEFRVVMPTILGDFVYTRNRSLDSISDAMDGPVEIPGYFDAMKATLGAAADSAGYGQLGEVRSGFVYMSAYYAPRQDDDGGHDFVWVARFDDESGGTIKRHYAGSFSSEPLPLFALYNSDLMLPTSLAVPWNNPALSPALALVKVDNVLAE
jgi:hypothetical protein